MANAVLGDDVYGEDKTINSLEDRRNESMKSGAPTCDDHSNNTGGQLLGGRVKINVGGKLFEASLSTLTRFDDSMFSALVAGRWQKQNELFIDRNPKHFGKVLDYLRDGKYVVLPKDDYSLRSLQREAEFYNLPGLVEICSAELHANATATREKLDNPSRPSRVKINVGGTVFETLLSTLTKEKDSVFPAMIAKRGHGQEELFFDRSPELFPMVMDYLRDGKISTVFEDRDAQQKMQREAAFYNLPDLSMCVYKFGDKVYLIEGAIEKYCLLNVRESGQTQRLCKTCGFPVYGVTNLAVPLPTYIAAARDGVNVTYGVSPGQTLSMSNMNPRFSTVTAINSCCALIHWDRERFIHLPKTALRLCEFQ